MQLMNKIVACYNMSITCSLKKQVQGKFLSLEKIDLNLLTMQIFRSNFLI